MAITSFIGPVHRKAAAIDGQIELVCGAFSVHPEESKQTGESLFLNPNRVYTTYKEMMEKEKNLPADQRIDFVSVVYTKPCSLRPVEAPLESGFHVIVEKPIAFSLAEAKSLKKIVDKSGLILATDPHVHGLSDGENKRACFIKDGNLGVDQKDFR